MPLLLAGPAVQGTHPGQSAQDGSGLLLAALDGELQGGSAGKELFQVVRGVAGHQPAPGDNHDLLAYRPHLGQDMAAEDDGVLLPQLPDQIPDLDDLDGVQAHGGFVQDHHLGVAQQGLGNANPLFVALGQVLDQPVLYALDLRDLHGVLELPLPVLPADALGLGHEAQIFQRGHIQVKGRLLRQVADERLGLGRLVKNIVAVDPHGALRGGQAAGHDIHGGGFPGSVWPQKAVDLPRFHRQAQIRDRGMAAVTFGKVIDLNQIRSLLASMSAGRTLPTL